MSGSFGQLVLEGLAIIAEMLREKGETMTPAEVIDMRDQLSEWLDTEYWDNTDELAESLIKSGWVVSPPKNEGGN